MRAQQRGSKTRAEAAVSSRRIAISPPLKNDLHNKQSFLHKGSITKTIVVVKNVATASRKRECECRERGSISAAPTPSFYPLTSRPAPVRIHLARQTRKVPVASANATRGKDANFCATSPINAPRAIGSRAISAHVRLASCVRHRTRARCERRTAMLARDERTAVCTRLYAMQCGVGWRALLQDSRASIYVAVCLI
jgi:hypothetical protein